MGHGLPGTTVGIVNERGESEPDKFADLPLPELARVLALISRQTVVELIASTTTKANLTACCELDTGTYLKGIQISKEQITTMNITDDASHLEWNYTVSPGVPT